MRVLSKLLIVVFVFSTAISFASPMKEKKKKKKEGVVRVGYTISERHLIMPLGTINKETLSVVDKLRFSDKSYSNRYIIDFNDADNYREEIRFINEDNMFPAYYTPPKRTIQDEKGGHSNIFTKRAKYFF